jgi:hypothetical protein
LGLKISDSCHHRSFDDDTSSNILPKRNQKFARERNNRRFLETAAIVRYPLLKPEGKCEPGC